MNVLHPWHGVPPGSDAPNTVACIIEIPKGSRLKYELDKSSGLLKLDRIIHSSFHYPTNYGFIPQTLGEDGDPLDILVITNESVQALCLTQAIVIGNMQMIDNGEKDDKIIAVAAGDPEFRHIRDIDELPDHSLSMLRHFFEQYKVLENKKVVIDAFQPRQEAYAVIEDCITRYQKTYSV